MTKVHKISLSLYSGSRGQSSGWLVRRPPLISNELTRSVSVGWWNVWIIQTAGAADHRGSRLACHVRGYAGDANGVVPVIRLQQWSY